MAAGRFDVAKGTRALNLDLVLAECANRAGGQPHGEHSRRDPRPRSNDRTRRDPGVLADLRSVENDRSDPDERTIPDATTMNDRSMPDGDLVAQKRRESTRCDMQRRLVLDIRAFADPDPLDIAT